MRFSKFKGVKCLSRKSGGVIFLTNLMSELIQPKKIMLMEHNMKYQLLVSLCYYLEMFVCTAQLLRWIQFLHLHLVMSIISIVKGTTDPKNWVLWLIQHLQFKAKASTSIESLVKLQLFFVRQMARNTKNNFDKFT